MNDDDQAQPLAPPAALERRLPVSEDDRQAVLQVLIAQRGILEAAAHQIDAALRLLAKEPTTPPAEEPRGPHSTRTFGRKNRS